MNYSLLLLSFILTTLLVRKSYSQNTDNGTFSEETSELPPTSTASDMDESYRRTSRIVGSTFAGVIGTVVIGGIVFASVRFIRQRISKHKSSKDMKAALVTNEKVSFARPPDEFTEPAELITERY
ncbi:unnamed protein product [Didymodactylos carnosus]|uniref:Uncharacterized protein n=1 Tax=Didymodactylos carnosus TaxID=1234261 RepID=A0A814SMI6_9BILA|nr:unnamed protein product [Didymodactylos carnosus]CAF1326568.1 unnamed protein product [Didymodactylos carnosus]CAF3913072.1 unnamed protein product [Didymodactylos carnosus]CAF4137769.1 unnamed protein product [Didymodactylos carnosus]